MLFQQIMKCIFNPINFKQSKLNKMSSIVEQEPIRVRKNLLGAVEPSTVPMSVSTLFGEEYFPKFNLCPSYQRDIRWHPTAMNDFIGTIMNNGLVPGIILYQLRTEEQIGENAQNEYEVVDGQHRLYTINAFMEAKEQTLTRIPKPFMVYWDYSPDTPVFYKETDDVREWCVNNKKTPKFLTKDETKYFKKYQIITTNLRYPMTLNARKEIFMSLQKGVPVRNSDFLKNITDCKLVEFISGHGYKQLMNEEIIKKHCYKKTSDYWLHWVTRCFLMFVKKNCKGYDKEAVDIFAIEDKKLNKVFKTNPECFNPDDDVLDRFDTKFQEFVTFLKDCGEKKFNPTQLFALFHHLCDETTNRVNVLSHASNFATNGYQKKYRTLWESNEENGMTVRKDYFNKCLTEIKGWTEPASPKDTRPITKTLKKQVWEKAVNKGKCDVCNKSIVKDNFEAGHVIARSLGGQTELNNLIPMCFDCNRNMGTRNAYEFKQDVYPRLCACTYINVN